MQELFISYIWQYQKFDQRNLLTTSGEPLTIINPGILNSNAGPDFDQSRVRIAEIDWRGQVELHVRSSDWDRHGHQNDPAYNNVILHVVWQNDKTAYRADGTTIPTLVLEGKVDKSLITNHETLISSLEPIPCGPIFYKVDPIRKLSMIDRTVVERLERKSGEALEYLNQTNGDWDQVAMIMICKGMGLKVNAPPFQKLGERANLKLLAQTGGTIKKIEALLFGWAGLLEKPRGDYALELKHTFDFYSQKHGLKPAINAHEWKFLRLRPANFPTLRIGQLAGILSQETRLFSFLVKYPDLKKIEAVLRAAPSEYWQKHYDFEKPSGKKLKGPGSTTFDLLLINAIAPMMVAYSQTQDDPAYTEYALSLLEKVKPEQNKITRIWGGIGYNAKNALDSQGLIELYHQYCAQKKCLSCAIGTSLISSP